MYSNAGTPPSGEFSTTVRIRASKYARWAVRVKNGSSAIPHPQIHDPQSLDPSAMIDDIHSGQPSSMASMSSAKVR